MKYFFSVGEHSADMHAATLVRRIRELDPEARFWGMGGPLMAQEGVEILYDPTGKGTIGFKEALGGLFQFLQCLKRFKRFFIEHSPDVLVWVDFEGFNQRLAEIASALDIPVVCLFAPSAWAYGRKRAIRMSRTVTHLASTFPFEADFFQRFGMKVTFTGHPIRDRVKAETPPQLWREKHQVKEGERAVVLMPGSRRQEIATLLPVMLEAAERLVKEYDNLKFFIPLAPSIPRDLILSNLANFSGEITILEREKPYDLMAAADFGVIVSGTSTLEAALLGLPVIVLYRVSGISSFIYHLLRNKEEQKGAPLMIAMPNILAGRMVLPELVQENLNADRLFLEMRELLTDHEKRRQIKKELEMVGEQLGSPGVMERVAQIVVAEAQAGGE